MRSWSSSPRPAAATSKITCYCYPSARSSQTPHELSLRLLRHYASSVHHQQYHGTDIITVRVSGQGADLPTDSDQQEPTATT